MANHNVTLNYTPPGNPQGAARFAPDENPIRVHAGQTIAFHIGVGPPRAKFRLTFADPALFSTANPDFHTTGRVNDGDGEVTVVKTPAARTTYRCELFVDGVVQVSSSNNAGGDVLPDGI